MTNFKAGFILCCALFLTACMGAGSGAGPAVTAGKMPGGLKQALCSNEPSTALGILNKVEETPSNRLFAAIALYQGGKAVTARGMLATLARAGHSDGVKIKCGSLNLQGTVSAVAAEQLVDIQRLLVAHDVQLVPKQTLHSSLEAREDTAKATAPKAPKNAAAELLKVNTTITMPLTANMNGTWFAHFASYFDQSKANTAISTFEKRYPALQGALDLWRVNSRMGTVWRVGVPVEEWSDADRLCIAVKASDDYCKVYDRLAQ